MFPVAPVRKIVFLVDIATGSAPSGRNRSRLFDYIGRRVKLVGEGLPTCGFIM
jgi:hypothetical protein